MSATQKSYAADDKDVRDTEIHPVDHDDTPSLKNLPPTGPIRDDDVEAFIAAHGGVQTYSAESDKKLLRRIDMRIMPLMMVTYCLQYVDKSAVSYAAVFGIREDLKLTGYEFNLLTSLFYIAYLTAEYPMAWLSQKFHVGKFLGIIIFLWGLTLMATALCHNFSQIAGVRFVLGWFEAALTPSFIMITGMWYTRQEQPLRVGIWYAMNGFGNMFGALCSYGMGSITVRNFQSWRLIFIIEGGVTVVWAFVIFLYFPGSPMRVRWLTPEQSVQAMERIRSNRTGILNRTWKWSQAREALDPRIDPIPWLLFWTCVFNEVINGAIAPFKTLITRSLGWNSFQSALFGIAQGFALTSYIVAAGFLASRKTNFRCYAAMIFTLPSLLGLILLASVPVAQIGVRTFALLLLPSFIGSLAITMGLPSQNTAGQTKRTVAVGMAFIGYCVGNIIGPFSMVEGQTPQYMSGFLTCIVCIACQLVCFSTLRWYWVRQNRKRDADINADVVLDGEEFADMTDKQDKRFRYNL